MVLLAYLSLRLDACRVLLEIKCYSHTPLAVFARFLIDSFQEW